MKLCRQCRLSLLVAVAVAATAACGARSGSSSASAPTTESESASASVPVTVVAPASVLAPAVVPQRTCWSSGDSIVGSSVRVVAWPAIVSEVTMPSTAKDGYPHGYRRVDEAVRTRRMSELGQAYAPLSFGIDRFGFVSSVAMPKRLCDQRWDTPSAVAAATAVRKTFVAELVQALPGVLVGEFIVVDSSAEQTSIGFRYVGDYVPNYVLGPQMVEQTDAQLLKLFSKQRIALVQSIKREQIIKVKKQINPCVHAGRQPCDPPGPARREWIETKTWASAPISAKSISAMRRFDAVYLTKAGIEIRRVVEPQLNETFFDELARQRKIPNDASYDFVILGGKFRDAVTGEVLDQERLRTDWRTL